MGHRIVWSFLFAGGLLLAWRRWRSWRALDRRSLSLYLLAAALISVNWLAYIWGVVHDRVLECSLGYFVNPLVTVSLGAVVLREPLGRGRRIALGLAALAVGWLAWSTGSLPWLPLVLALSFGFYGLVKKRTPLPALDGLWLETALLLPVALGWLAFAHSRGTEPFANGSGTVRLLLVLAGPVTTLPLLLFAAAARRAKLSTLGFVQYLTPSMQFLIGIFLLGEPLDRARLAGFGLVWVAIGVVVADGARRSWSRS